MEGSEENTLIFYFSKCRNNKSPASKSIIFKVNILCKIIYSIIRDWFYVFITIKVITLFIPINIIIDYIFYLI